MWQFDRRLPAPEAPLLYLVGLLHLLTHDRAGGTAGVGLEGHGRDFNVQVDGVQQGAANLPDVALDQLRVARARPPAVPQVAARARVHRRRQDQIGRQDGQVMAGAVVTLPPCTRWRSTSRLRW
jgi:hypothetical protein